MQVLEKWSARINLTAIKETEEVFVRHILDSLMLLRLERLNLAGRAVDLGSGAGFPAIPLAIFLPELEVVSVDSVGKKIAFQDVVKGQLKLKNLKPTHARHEDLIDTPSHHEAYDLIVTRALDQMQGLFDLAYSFLKPGGKIAMWKGQGYREELAQVTDETLEHFRLLEVQRYELDLEKGGRILLFEKWHGLGSKRDWGV